MEADRYWQFFSRAGAFYAIVARSHGESKLAIEGGEGAMGRNQAISVTIFAVASLEAFVNEAVEVALREEREGDGPPQIIRFAAAGAVARTLRASLKEKYQIAHEIFTGERYDKGVQPWSDFALLVDARNALVHSTPESKGGELPGSPNIIVSNAKLVKRLWRKGVIAKATDLRFAQGTSADWPMILLSPNMERWASDTAVAMVESFTDAVPRGVVRDLMAEIARQFRRIEE